MLTAEHAHIASMAQNLFSDEMKAGMKAFKAHPTATYFNHLNRTMIVWQQFDQLQRKACFQEQLEQFLTEAPHVPMGTWGNMVCLLTSGMGLTARELSKRI